MRLALRASSPRGAQVAAQLFVWDAQEGAIVGARDGQCLTLGLPNLPPAGAKYETNNGTLHHEVWAGPLASAQQVVVLFNKGAARETLSAAWRLLHQPASRPCPVRDVLARKALPPLAAGADLTAEVPPHGVRLFVLG